jgi:hypothetical protein
MGRPAVDATAAPHSARCLAPVRQGRIARLRHRRIAHRAQARRLPGSHIERKAWASLPSKPVLERDGQQKTDVNGKPAYGAILGWRSHELSDRFSQVVITAIRQMYPGALDEAGP